MKEERIIMNKLSIILMLLGSVWFAHGTYEDNYPGAICMVLGFVGVLYYGYRDDL